MILINTAMYYTSLRCNCNYYNPTEWKATYSDHSAKVKSIVFRKFFEYWISPEEKYLIEWFQPCICSICQSVVFLVTYLVCWYLKRFRKMLGKHFGFFYLNPCLVSNFHFCRRNRFHKLSYLFLDFHFHGEWSGEFSFLCAWFSLVLSYECLVSCHLLLSCINNSLISLKWRRFLTFWQWSGFPHSSFIYLLYRF